MRSTLCPTLGPWAICAGLLMAGTALADQSYVVSKVTITGNRSVSTDQLMAVVQERPGQHITVNDILADRDAISKVLESAHVQGSVKPSIRSQGGKSEVVFVVEDQGVHAPVVTKVAPKLDQQIFEGNTAIQTAQLMAATGLKPGDELTNDKITAAQLAIQQTYKAAKLPIAVNISGENKQMQNGTYDVVWHITETKAKKKHSGEDEGFKSE